MVSFFCFYSGGAAQQDNTSEKIAFSFREAYRRKFREFHSIFENKISTEHYMLIRFQFNDFTNLNINRDLERASPFSDDGSDSHLVNFTD